MIQELVDRYMKNKLKLEDEFKLKHPGNYKDIVTSVIKLVTNEAEYSSLDPERIHEIDDGDYQGTLLFVIGGTGYQPDDYWYVKVGYGSCSGCDTLEAIHNYDDNPPNDEQVKDYMTLSLHIVQGLKKMGGEVV